MIKNDNVSLVKVLMKIGVVLLCYMTLPTFAQSEKDIYGIWEGNDLAAESVYGILQISPVQVAWANKHPRDKGCQSKYSVAGKEEALDFEQDHHKSELKIPPEASGYVLKLDDTPCALGVKYMYVIHAQAQPLVLRLRSYNKQRLLVEDVSFYKFQ